MQGIKKNLRILLIAGILLGVWGCGFNGGPRARWGFTPKQYYGDPNDLGNHSYGFGGREGYGIFYTLRGGSIDLDHVRGAADLTRHTYNKTYDTLIKKKKKFSVGPAFEMTTNTIRIEYPSDWDQLSETQKQQIAHEVALILAPVISYYSTLWHEMLTWEGLRFAIIEPEHESAFSWEDLYSNALGTQLAIQILQDGKLSTAQYNQAMTDLIQEEFDKLHVVSKEQALQIRETVRGSWFTTFKLMKRNMDVGFDDGMITPCLIPGITDEDPVSIPMPTLEGLDQYGITIKYTIRSMYLENGALKHMAETSSSVEPLKQYPLIMEKIEREAIEKYDYQIR